MRCTLSEQHTPTPRLDFQLLKNIVSKMNRQSKLYLSPTFPLSFLFQTSFVYPRRFLFDCFPMAAKHFIWLYRCTNTVSLHFFKKRQASNHLYANNAPLSGHQSLAASPPPFPISAMHKRPRTMLGGLNEEYSSWKLI